MWLGHDVVRELMLCYSFMASGKLTHEQVIDQWLERDLTAAQTEMVPELQPHDGQSNIVFLDGHAKAFSDYNKDEMTWHGRKMTNWDLK